MARRVKQALRSGVLTAGPHVAAFEDHFAAWVGVHSAVAVNSATAALHLLLQAHGIGPGDEVIVPANTFVATANAAVYVGARPVLVDVEPDTFNIDPHAVARAMTAHTKAVIGVHFAGEPFDVEAVRAAMDDPRVFLFEDCAHAHGATFQGARCGSLADGAAFSFYPNKILSSAEGGVAMARDERAVEEMRMLRNAGRRASGPSPVERIGYNYRMNELQAIIVSEQLRVAEAMLSERRHLAEHYREAFDRQEALAGLVRPQASKVGNGHSYYAFVVHVANGRRDALRTHLGTNGIETSILYHPVHQMPAYARMLGDRTPSCPVAEEHGRASLALPMFNGMTTHDVEHVVHEVGAFFGTY